MKGWSKKRLVEITEKIGSGATPRGGNDAYKESGISLFRSLNVHDGFFKEKNLAFIDEDQASKLSNVQVKEGDVLLNITGASIARCCIAPSELLPARVNQHVAIIRPKLNYVDTNFLAYLFISKEYKDALLNTGEKAGATRQALTKIQLQEFEINIPPLSEQKRIVSIVDEAFEAIDIAIDNTKQNLTNARELFDSYLNAIFMQKGEGWKEKKFSDVAILSRGQNPPKSKFINNPKEGYVRFYQIRDGKNDNFEVYVPDSPQLHKVEPDDILMVAYRHIGKVFRGADGAFNVALCKIKNKDRSVMNDDYLFHIIPTDFVRGELMKQSERSLIPSMSVKHLYESFGLDFDLLDPLFLEDIESQMEVFGGTLFDPPSYEGFFQTDREGRPKGAIVLDPKEMITQSGGQS